MSARKRCPALALCALLVLSTRQRGQGVAAFQKWYSYASPASNA